MRFTLESRLKTLIEWRNEINGEIARLRREIRAKGRRRR